MSLRIGPVLALAATLSGCKDREPASGSAVPAPAPAPAPAPVLPPGPQLPATPDAGIEPDAPSTEQQWDGESRDAAWAPQAERDVTRWVTGIPKGTALTVECRSSICRLTFGGHESTMVAATASAEAGLRGHVDRIVLDWMAPPFADGTTQLVVFAVFDR